MLLKPVTGSKWETQQSIDSMHAQVPPGSSESKKKKNIKMKRGFSPRQIYIIYCDYMNMTSILQL